MEADISCNQAFEEWYSMQRHQLNNESLCHLIWRRGWEAAEREWRTPLTRDEIKGLATYMPEGVSDDDVENLVRQVEQMHGLIHSNARHKPPCEAGSA